MASNRVHPSFKAFVEELAHILKDNSVDAFQQALSSEDAERKMDSLIFATGSNKLLKRLGTQIEPHSQGTTNLIKVAFREIGK